MTNARGYECERDGYPMLPRGEAAALALPIFRNNMSELEPDAS
jgi:hypothetical protein